MSQPRERVKTRLTTVDNVEVKAVDAGGSHGRPRPVLLGTSDGTAKDFARRRRWFVLPSFLGALALVTRALTNGESWLMVLAILLLTVVIYAVTVALIKARDRAADRRFAGKYLFASFGRFPWDEAADQPSLASVLAGVDPGRLGTARGLVEGTLAVGREHLLFEPGRIASRAGVRRIVWGWDSIESVELVPQRLSFASGLRVRFRDGAVLDLEVRGHGRLPGALKAALAHS